MLIRPLYLNNDLLAVCDETDVLDCQIDWINVINKPPVALQDFITPSIICDNIRYSKPTIPYITGTIVFDKFRLIQRYIDPTQARTVNNALFTFDTLDYGQLLPANWYSLFLINDNGTVIPRLTTLVRVHSATIVNDHAIVTLGQHLNPSAAISSSDIGWTDDIFGETNGLAIILSGTSIYDFDIIIGNSTSGNAQITLEKDIQLNQGDWICISPMGYDNYTLVGSVLNKDDNTFLPFIQSYSTVIYLDEILLWRGRTNSYSEIDANLISPLATFMLDVSCISTTSIWQASFSIDGSHEIRFLRNYRYESDGLAFLPLTENKSIFVDTDNTNVNMYVGGFAY